MKDNLKTLDGLRGLAACYVLIHHARLALTQSFQSGLNLYPEKYSLLDKCMTYFFGLFKFGHEAVIIFFVLSGFVIHLKQVPYTTAFEKFNTLHYLKKRIIRIYPTLLFSFALCVILDYLVYLCLGSSFSTLFEKYTLSTFLFNFFLIPDTSIWGNNFPVWSLAHEWFFYLFYPLLLWLAAKNKLLPITIIISLFISFLLGIKIPYIGSAAYTLLIWCIGAFLAEIYINKKEQIAKYIPFLLALIIIYPFINRIDKNTVYLDLIFGLIVAAVLYLIITKKINFVSQNLAKFSWLGTFSYSIYLLHSPLLNTYQHFLIYFSPNKMLPFHLWHVFFSILIVLPIIYLFYYFTERLAINYKRKIT